MLGLDRRTAGPVVGAGVSGVVLPGIATGMDGESLLWFLLVLALFGLIVGAIARLLVPGPTPMGALATMGAGVAGALIGGFVGRLLFGPGFSQGWNWVLSILGAVLVVALVSRRGGGYYGRRAGPGVVADDYDEVVVEEVHDPYPRRRRRWF